LVGGGLLHLTLVPDTG